MCNVFLLLVQNFILFSFRLLRRTTSTQQHRRMKQRKIHWACERASELKKKKHRMKRKTNRLANPTLMCVFVHSWSLHEANTSPNKKVLSTGWMKRKSCHVRTSPCCYAFQRPNIDSIPFALAHLLERMNEQTSRPAEQEDEEEEKPSWKNSLSRTHKTHFSKYFHIKLESTQDEAEGNFLFFEWYRHFLLCSRMLFCTVFKTKWNETHFFPQLWYFFYFCFSFAICFVFQLNCFCVRKLYIALMNRSFFVFHVTKTNSTFFSLCYSQFSSVCIDLALIRIIWSNLRQWFHNNVSGNA